ncbi:hypothetical protein [Streptomyces sp. UG1]
MLHSLRQDRTVETGTHKELIAKEGTYAELVALQSDALNLRDADPS